MSTENSYEQSVDSSTQASSTPGPDTPSVSEIMSTTPTAELQVASPAYENMFRSFLDTFENLRAEMTRLEIENKRLVDYNTVIEKELETLNEENVKLSRANDDAMKKLAESDEKNARLQKEFSELEELKEVLGWKKRCEELENRTTENQERTEKLLEDYQQKTEKWIAEVQQQSQRNLGQAINRIKALRALQMQGLNSVMAFMGLEDLKDGYIFREKPLKMIPNGMIQVSRAKAASANQLSDDPLYENEGSGFLYVVRDQYKDFEKFTKIAESVFRLGAGHLWWLQGTKSDFPMCCRPGGMFHFDKAGLINKWQKVASQKDRIYISRFTLYYVEE
ncbi:hypothetical protein FPQ18DRAFT_375206 [Pyronema domesticum]|uniref:Uncharacterized protein n=1 Tax=Pyronema omphalodes (strain CBS 100304) TaxID=1076935 RepID=U4LFW6_PYROM|nr:hypothetical protein FPQ18DRAFT_375206 [Pyronema domesticum]CCX30778.1 Protein of unknown function [Pyronema omphalodes CBS 100304]